MADPDAVIQPKSVKLHAVVIRADGRVEDIGLVSAYYKSVWRRMWWRVYGKPRAWWRAVHANRSAKKPEGV